MGSEKRQKRTKRKPIPLTTQLDGLASKARSDLQANRIPQPDMATNDWSFTSLAHADRVALADICKRLGQYSRAEELLGDSTCSLSLQDRAALRMIRDQRARDNALDRQYQEAMKKSEKGWRERVRELGPDYLEYVKRFAYER